MAEKRLKAYEYEREIKLIRAKIYAESVDKEAEEVANQNHEQNPIILELGDIGAKTSQIMRRENDVE